MPPPPLLDVCPPPNNIYHGMPVYPNVNISSSSSPDDDDDRKKRRNVSVAASACNADNEVVFVITGASWSMGLQFVRELMGRTHGRIVACVLRPGSAPDLDAYLGSLIVDGDDQRRVDVRRLNMMDAEQIDRLVEEVGSTYGRVDGLFNVVGALGGGKDTPGLETNIGQIDWGWAMS
ncbi:hypothetical protein ACHAW5_008018 [Stephanodiscus triporus]|uniref:Ketoreductase (KR) domain-containing protein n=1 Tax=Stephanodiscus triporus TaxID=2934178 RepID=A0ABD3P7S3_9STRA